MKLFKYSPPAQRMFGSDVTVEPTGIEVGPIYPDWVVCLAHDGEKWCPSKNHPYALSLDPRPTARVPKDVEV